MLDPESSSSTSKATHFITKRSGLLLSATILKAFCFLVFASFFLPPFSATVLEGGRSVLRSGGAFLLGLLLAGAFFVGEDIAAFLLAVIFGEEFAAFYIDIVVV